jgi:hypothetical protein
MEDLAASDASDVSDSVESSTASAPVCAAADSVVVCSSVAEGAAVAVVVVIVVEEPILAEPFVAYEHLQNHPVLLNRSMLQSITHSYLTALLTRFLLLLSIDDFGLLVPAPVGKCWLARVRLAVLFF